MKVVIRNKSSKKRSYKQYKELRQFTISIAKEFGIYDQVETVYLTFRDEFPKTYYPKGQPLAGFFKCWNGNRVSISLCDFWDGNMNDRKSAIVHELTHTKQMINKELIVFKNGKTIKWKNKLNHTWKNFKFKVHDSMSDRKKQDKYLCKHFPWEKEVGKNLDKYLGYVA